MAKLGPVTATHHLNYYPFGWIKKLFQSFFILFNFLAYDTFFLKIHTSQTDCPKQFFFLAKICWNVQITLGSNLRPNLIKASTQPNFRTAPQAKNGNNFFLPTSKKIDTFIDFFLITTHLRPFESGDWSVLLSTSTRHSFAPSFSLLLTDVLRVVNADIDTRLQILLDSFSKP